MYRLGYKNAYFIVRRTRKQCEQHSVLKARWAWAWVPEWGLPWLSHVEFVALLSVDPQQCVYRTCIAMYFCLPVCSFSLPLSPLLAVTYFWLSSPSGSVPGSQKTLKDCRLIEQLIGSLHRVIWKWQWAAFLFPFLVCNSLNYCTRSFIFYITHSG